MTAARPILGTAIDGGRNIPIDLPRLVETRLLAQANSGGGKSWLLRRLLEQTHGLVQHIVLDVEDEFYTLREKFDYVLAGRDGGDCPADVRSAPLLARRLMELRVSAIIGISELKAHDRVKFVRLFLEALMATPRALWHPALVVVDEAHMYCPEKGEAESSAAVIDLMTRGRKRGLCGVLATQRLSKLHKDAAAEANNKLIGRTGLDVDMKRAADELGFSSRDERLELRNLTDGEWFAFGPAISPSVIRLKVGDVTTTHPRPGQRALIPPAPPTDKVRSNLAKLADLPKEVEAEAQDVASLKRQVAELQRELRQKPKPEAPAKPAADPAALERERARGRAAGYREGFDEARRSLVEMLEFGKQHATTLAGIMTDKLREARTAKPDAAPAAPATPPPTPVVAAKPASEPRRAPMPRAPATQGNGHASAGDLKPVSQRIVDAIAELHALGVAQVPRIQVAVLARYGHLRSKGFTNALGELSTGGFIHYPSSGTIALTEAGHAASNAPDAVMTSADLQERLMQLLDGPGQRIVRALIDAYPESLAREDLASAAGYEHLRSKGFTNALGRLRSFGFVDYPSTGQVQAATALFLEEA